MIHVATLRNTNIRIVSSLFHRVEFFSEIKLMMLFILGLSATRLWNKKYPIVISSVARPGEDAKEVVLFARTCRDKEYWFRLLKKTSEQSLVNQTTGQPVKSDKDSPVSPNDEVYFIYVSGTSRRNYVAELTCFSYN